MGEILGTEREKKYAGDDKYSIGGRLGRRKIRDKRNKWKMNILGREIYRRGTCKEREKYDAGNKYWRILYRDMDMIG